MTSINLLPWREQTRKEELIRFGILLGFFVGLAVFLSLLIHIYFNILISKQQQHNSSLQIEFDRQKIALSALLNKQKEETAIEVQLKFFVALRNKTFEIVKLLDELSHAVPSEVSLNSIARVGNTITIAGSAETNSAITEFMKNLSKSKEFNPPELTQIKTDSRKDFQLKIVQTPPKVSQQSTGKKVA